MNRNNKPPLILALFGVAALCFYPFASLFHSNPDNPNDTLALLTALGSLAAAIISALAIRRVVTSRPLGLPLLVIIPALVLLAIGTIVGQSYQASQSDCFTPQPGYNYATDYISDGNGHYCWIKPSAQMPVPPFLTTLFITLILTSIVTGPTLLIMILLSSKTKTR